MPESKRYIRSRLKNRTDADRVTIEPMNNRLHYYLSFDTSIGCDWLREQVRKVNADTDVELELYKHRPDGDGIFTIDVREIERREGVDNDQLLWEDFE